MKILPIFLSAIITFHLNSTALAACDFSTGITQTEKGFLYTPDCHREVGRISKENEDRKEQAELYRKALDLKDIAMDAQRERADMWRDTSFKLEDKLSSIERFKRNNELLYFGLGVVLTVGAGWAVGQAAK